MDKLTMLLLPVLLVKCLHCLSGLERRVETATVVGTVNAVADDTITSTMIWERFLML